MPTRTFPRASQWYLKVKTPGPRLGSEPPPVSPSRMLFTGKESDSPCAATSGKAAASVSADGKTAAAPSNHGPGPGKNTCGAPGRSPTNMLLGQVSPVTPPKAATTWLTVIG